MPRIQHRAPIREGESPLNHPASDDSRFHDLMGILRNFCLIDSEGNAMKQYQLMRGIETGFYLWNVSWNGAAPAIESLKALDGRTFASLSPTDRSVLGYFIEHSRQHGAKIVAIAQPEDALISVALATPSNESDAHPQ